MKTLIVSDIHGNFAALEAVIAAEPHDNVVCLGDIVGYGPEPGRCVAWIRGNAELVVQGNHDCALATGAPAGSRRSFEWVASAMAYLGWEQTAREDIEWLGALPRWAFLALGGTRYLFVHATPSNPLYRYLGPEGEAWREEVESVQADVIVVGHTHIQFDVHAGGKRIVNAGSVGQPKDGDPRAAYAVVEDGAVRLGRVAYPIEETVLALDRTSAPRNVVHVLTELLRTGRVPASIDGSTHAVPNQPRTSPEEE